MKVILRSDVDGVGKRGDLLDVADGYGRNFLLRAVHGGRRYDVITADIIRPHHAGAGNLYSVEYFRLAAAALRDDGIMMQWLDPHPLYRHQLMLRTGMIRKLAQRANELP